MASMTIADMPDHILGRLERKAAKARRTLEQELIHLLERALSRDRPDDSGWTDADTEAQYQAWCRLGVWESDRSAEEEIRDIYSRRAPGRVEVIDRRKEGPSTLEDADRLQPEPKKSSLFGCMRGTAEIVGDIVSPLPEQDWEVFRS
jgi:plasmid stability protein